MSRLTRDGIAEPVLRDQILRHERGQGNVYFPCSAAHEQDWQPYSVGPYSCYMCDHTYILSRKPLIIHKKVYLPPASCAALLRYSVPVSQKSTTAIPTRSWSGKRGMLNVESYNYGILPSQVPIGKMEHESTAKINSLVVY